MKLLITICCTVGNLKWNKSCLNCYIAEKISLKKTYRAYPTHQLEQNVRESTAAYSILRLNKVVSQKFPSAHLALRNHVGSLNRTDQWRHILMTEQCFRIQTNSLVPRLSILNRVDECLQRLLRRLICHQNDVL